MKYATRSNFWIAADVVVSGVTLALVMRLVRGHFDDFSGTIIVCYLAIMLTIRLLFGGVDFQRNLAVKIAVVVGGIGLSVWLYHEATNARTGWYRTHVIQRRVNQIVSEAPAYVVLWNTQGLITGASNNIELLTGYYREELIGQPLTILLRPADRPGYLRGMAKAAEILRKDDERDTGWLMQGIITFGLVHRDGKIVPVKAYSGGIRWSQRIQFKGDTDLFAVFVPVEESELRRQPTTIAPKTPVQVAPPAPPTKTLVPDVSK